MFTHQMLLTKPAVGGGSGHTYWRVLCIDRSNANHYAIAEVEMKDTLGGSDLTSGETIIFGAERAVFPATEAFDDISQDGSDNAWGVRISDDPDPADHWIGIQFATAKDIIQITITSRADAWADQSPTEFKLQYSDNGTTWADALHVTGEAAWSLSEKRTYTV